LPYVSSEVLAIDNEVIYGEFFKNNPIDEKSMCSFTIDNEKDYFKELIGIFSSKAVDNEILMGYFTKIIQNLYKCKKV
jgi:hypothetical protein